MIEQFSSPASQIVLAPILSSRLGAEQFGLWATALSCWMLAPLLTFGRSLALLSTMGPAQAAQGSQTDSPTCAALVRDALWPLLFTTLGSLALAAVAGLVWASLAGGDSAHVNIGFCLMVAATLALTELDSVAGMALKGLGRFQSSAWIETLGRLLLVIACWALVAQGGSATHVLALVLTIQVPKALLKYLALRRALPPPRTGSDTLPKTAQAHDSGVSLRPFRHVGAWSVLQAVSGLLFYAYDRWLVGASVGLAAVGAYSICTQYAQFFHSLAAAGTQPLVTWAARRSDNAHRRMRQVAAGVALLAAAGPALAWLTAEPALSAWISPEFAREHLTLVRALCVGFGLLALNVPFVNLLIGLGHTRFVARLTLVAGLVLVAVSLLWPPHQLMDVAQLKIAYSMGGLLCVFRLWRLTRPSHA